MWSAYAVYNLITLFFNSEEVKNFAKLINMKDYELGTLSKELNIPIKYIYYFVGSVAVGKSSILSHLGSFEILEEWINERPSELATSYKQLEDEKVDSIDKWVNTQFRKKNDYLLNQNEGFFLVDRTPLDPLCFVKDDKDIKNRAKSMIEEIDDMKTGREIVSGDIIFLKSEPTEQKARLLTKRKLSWDEKTLSELNEKTVLLYQPIINKEVVNTRKKLREVVKEISKIIYTKEYNLINIHNKLLEIQENGII